VVGGNSPPTTECTPPIERERTPPIERERTPPIERERTTTVSGKRRNGDAAFIAANFAAFN